MSSIKPVVFIIYLTIFFPLIAQSQVVQDTIRFPANDVKPYSGFQPIPVLLLGAFHFDYPNLDGHKTDSLKRLDVLSPDRQKELDTLIAILKTFRPTRIYVEARNQKRLDSLYTRYLNGTYQLARSELYQVGFRLSKLLKHSKLYAVDASNFARENAEKYLVIDSFWIDRTFIDTNAIQQWNEAYGQSYRMDDSLTASNSLINTFLTNSDPETWNRLNGHQLVSNLGTTDDKGPDAIALQWYDRNLRIFNNIIRTNPQDSDRILVLFGAGHMSVLHHLFDCSPHFEPVLFRELVNSYFNEVGK